MDTLVIDEKNNDVQELAKRDPTIGKVIRYIRSINIPLRTDYSACLDRSIVGQQISVAAASAVFEQLKSLAGEAISIDAFHKITDDQLRHIGFSKRKIDYVRH